MKAFPWICGLLTMAALSSGAVAQAPAGATGQCKDGTYSTATSKDGACRGHKGVQAWYSQIPAGTSSKSTPAMAQKSPGIPAPAPAPVAAAPVRPPVASAPSTPAPAPAASAPPATTSAPALPGRPRASTASMAQAPGGGPGLVWVNTKSKVYHCSGDAFYGKTKAGKYLSEEAAKAEGDHADNNRPCAR